MTPSASSRSSCRPTICSSDVPINKRNFERYGLSPATAFEPCANLAAMQGILGECFLRASQRAPTQAALCDAFSCYYSGIFSTGHRHG